MENYYTPDEDLEEEDIKLRNMCRAISAQELAVIKPLWATEWGECQFYIDVVTDTHCYAECDTNKLFSLVLNISDLHYDPTFMGDWADQSRFATTFDRWRNGLKVDPPRLSAHPQGWIIGDGRHRAVLAGAIGAPRIIVSVCKSSLEDLKQKIDAKRVPLPSEPYYDTPSFLISIPAKSWNAVTDTPCNDKVSVSQLLHEYIHYLQATTTYYGHAHRYNLYDANSECSKDVKYGLSMMELKENMARNAQRYIHDDYCMAIPNNPEYIVAEDYAENIIKGIKRHPLLLFVIQYAALCTPVPIESFDYLLHTLSQSSLSQDWGDNSVDERIAEKVLVSCLSILHDANMIDDCDLPIEEAQHPQQFEIIRGVYKDIFLEDESLLGKHRSFDKITSKVMANCVGNMKKCLENNTLVVDVLMQFKQTMDFKTLFDVFGSPLMRCEDQSGHIITNVDSF